MTFKVRNPIVENPFLTFYASSSETMPVSAGKLVYLVGDRIVDVVTTASSQTPVGWLMQKVKAAYTELPADMVMRSDLGSSDAFVGDPVGVASGPGAVYETDQYVDEASDGIAYGTLLYCDNDGKLSDSNADTAADASAIALNTLTAAECTAGEMLLIKSLI
jgi:hypothetical protein